MKIKKLTVVFLPLLIVYVCGFENVVAIECSRQALPIASDALITSDEVEVSIVEVDSWDGTTPAEADDNIYYAFIPKYTAPVTAFIILPGGNTYPKAYAPAAHQIASGGYLTVILPVPECLAMPSDVNIRVDKIISDFEEIEKWAIGGHSLGGATACVHAKKNDNIDGLIIWASFSPIRLDNTNLKVITIYGSEDGRCTLEEVKFFAKLLPEDTVYVEIEGGNHTQFAYYDTSPDLHMERDNAATITLEEQQEIIISHTSDFLSNMPHIQQPDGGCPAVYLLGEDNPQLDTIMQFRDKVMAKTAPGRALIEFYYRNQVNVITILDEHPSIKNSARKILASLIPIIENF